MGMLSIAAKLPQTIHECMLATDEAIDIHFQSQPHATAWTGLIRAKLLQFSMTHQSWIKVIDNIRICQHLNPSVIAALVQ